MDSMWLRPNRSPRKVGKKLKTEVIIILRLLQQDDPLGT
jgi:hypothetical protein